MNKIQLTPLVGEDGSIVLKDLPVQPGQQVRVVVYIPEKASGDAKPQAKTIGAILQSNAIGMWADRVDIKDSADYARSLRKKVQQRNVTPDDPGGY